MWQMIQYEHGTSEIIDTLETYQRCHPIMSYCRGNKQIRQWCVLTHLNTEMHLQLCLRGAPGKPPLQHEGKGPFFSYWKCVVCSSFLGTGIDGRNNGKGAGNPGRTGRIEDTVKTQLSPCICILHLGMTSRLGSIYRQPAHAWKPKRAFAGVMLPPGRKVKVCPDPVPMDSGSWHPDGIAPLGVLLLCAYSIGYLAPNGPPLKAR